MPEPIFSLIVPTRGRRDSLIRLCDSIRAQTSDLDRVEIIFVVDSDDRESLEFDDPRFHIRKAEVVPGMAMGELNMAGYRASTGRYLMLLNDDVVLRTPGWDERVLEVFRSYPDGIVLVHVNETIFLERLCTFPFLTRTFCDLAGGICPSGYLRYRIDDHIHNVFDLLALLGQRRRIYLPDVIFEHHNVVQTEGGHNYVPQPDIHAVDTRLFEALLPERKRLTLAAMETIDRHARSEKLRVWEGRLAPVSDSVAIRDPRHALRYPTPDRGGDRPRVTVAIVSAGLQSDHARQCIARVKEHTENLDLVIVDNNLGAGFNHAREMNRLIEFSRTDYLVLLDDDVFVEAGWLEGMLRAMGPDVGVVTPVHYDRNGKLSYAGVVLRPDDSGHHTHVLKIGERPQSNQTLCSAAMLIHLPRCGHVRLDERYSKYFLDIDYGLRIWEEGFHVVCSPWTRVTHLGGATLEQGSGQSVQLFEEQRLNYVREWVKTRRIHALRLGAWRSVPEFVELSRLTREIDGLFFEGTRLSREAFLGRVRTVAGELGAYPALRDYAMEQARVALRGRPARADDADTGHLAIILGSLDFPVLYEAAVQGLNVVLWKDRLFALPADEGIFDPHRMRRGGYSSSYESADLHRLKEMIAKGKSRGVHVSDGESHLPSVAEDATAGIRVLEPPGGSGQPAARRTLMKRLIKTIPFVRVLRPRGEAGAGNLFDPDYYRTTYPDVAAAGINPLIHFVTAGAFEGRNPHPLFDTAFYLRKYADVAAAGVNALGHYLKHGAREGRQPHPLFDPVFYLERYPDVRKAGINPLLHYCLFGAFEGRQPHTWFQPEYYLSQCAEARVRGENPLVHFLRSAGALYRPHPLFDGRYYLEENADVSASGLNPLVHYVLFGASEGRRPSLEFDPCDVGSFPPTLGTTPVESDTCSRSPSAWPHSDRSPKSAPGASFS